jgi:hypothetical protein
MLMAGAPMGIVRDTAVVGAVLALMAGDGRDAAAQSAAPSIELIVIAGRPVRVALDQRVRIARAGQPVTGTVVEDVYAYDRVVIPAGTKALGRVARIDGASKATRAQAWLGGDFTPPRHPVLEFDTVVLNDQRLAIQTVVTGTDTPRSNSFFSSHPGD